MRKINVFMIILLIGGITLTYLLWHKKNNDKAIIKPKETSINVSKNLEPPKDKLSVQEKLKQSKSNGSQLKIVLANRIQAFHPEPAVDSELISITLDHCLKLINPNNHERHTSYYKSLDNLSENQIKYKKDINDYCQNLNKTHPEYMLEREEDIKILRESVNKNTEIGKILSKHYNDETIKLEPSELAAKIQHLKSNDPNLLFKASSYFQAYLGEKLHNNIGIMIKSEDDNYIYLISESATDLFACDAGASCGQFSHLMSQYCVYRNLCGSDFNDILNNKMPEGIRSDIMLVFNYLKESFD
ncbi:MAG: hypothetical protein AB8B80_09385 [Marinicellaceae bacterium]